MQSALIRKLCVPPSADEHPCGAVLNSYILLQGANQQPASRQSERSESAQRVEDPDEDGSAVYGDHQQPTEDPEPIDETSYLHPFSLDVSRRSLLQLAPELDGAATPLEPGLFTSTSSGRHLAPSLLNESTCGLVHQTNFQLGWLHSRWLLCLNESPNLKGPMQLALQPQGSNSHQDCTTMHNSVPWDLWRWHPDIDCASRLAGRRACCCNGSAQSSDLHLKRP